MAVSMTAFFMPVWGQEVGKREVELTQAQTARLTIAVQKEENVRLSIANLQLQLQLLQSRYQEIQQESQQTWAAVCEEAGVDVKTAEPRPDLKAIIVGSE